MSSVREKLAQYRASKATEKPSSSQNEVEDTEKLVTSVKTDSESPSKEAYNEIHREPKAGATHIVGIALKLGLWFLLWGLSIECDFGVVYVIVSGLLLMVYSLYGSRRSKHEPSAYSVFNEGCETIDGTLTAAQFERELRYGPANVRQ